MKNAWFVLCLVASILINAAIVDSARIEPLPPVVGSLVKAPALETRNATRPPPAAHSTRPAPPVEVGALALDEPELQSIGTGSRFAQRR